MKLTDVLALAKLGYTAEDVKTFLADNSEETESTYKAELEKIQKESSGSRISTTGASSS